MTPMPRLGPAIAYALVLVALLASVVPVRGQEIPTIFLYVNDLASPGALLRDEENALDSLCTRIDELSSAEVAIVVVNTTAPMAIEEFGFRTFEANAIGKAGKDNGLLIVLAVDDGAWRIEVGYGLEGILPDSKVAQYARTWLEPAINASDYYGGLYDVTLAIGQDIVDNYDQGGGASNPQLWVLDWRGIALGVAVVVVVGVLTRGRAFLWVGEIFKRGGFGGGRSGGGGASGRL